MDYYLTLIGFGPTGWGRAFAEGALVTISLAVATLPFGLGLGLLPTFIIGKDLQEGRLLAVLSDYIPVDRYVYAMYLPTRHLPSKVRVFIYFLV